MKSILFANQSSGYLMIDIVNAFSRSGKYDRVELFAGEVNIRPSVPDSSVHVIKTIKYDKKNVFKRLCTWMGAFFHLLLLVWRRGKDCELFLVSNPPLNVFIPLFTRKRYSILIYDLYPDSLISQGFAQKNSFLVKWWSNVNKKVLGKAHNVFTISDDMRLAVARYVNKEKVQVVYNWAHNEHLKPIPKHQNTFLDEQGLQGKFIILYSGNMGMTHDIDVIVDVADKLKHRDDIRFLFIGDGAKKPIIEQKIKNYGLGNCLVLSFQPLEVLPYSMGAADIAVVTTDANQTGLSVPSKTYSYLSTGAILLCLAEKQSELGRMVIGNQVGMCFNRNELKQMAEFVEEMADNAELSSNYKANSRQLSLAYTPVNANSYVY